MLVYDLICSQGHHFEGWFKNIDDLQDQLQLKSISCPICHDEDIKRLPSTFGLVKSKSSQVQNPQAQGSILNNLLEKWTKFSKQLDENFDDVGSDFAEEALKMHYGVADRRNIRGLSSKTQDDMLRKEGVEFFKLPMFRKNSYPDKN